MRAAAANGYSKKDNLKLIYSVIQQSKVKIKQRTDNHH
jgi:hypothetical protein